MAADFPGSLASLARPTAQTKRNAPGYEGHALHNKLADEIEAIEAVIGVTGSTVPTSIEYRLADVQDVADGAASDVGALQAQVGAPGSVVAGTIEKRLADTESVAAASLGPGGVAVTVLSRIWLAHRGVSLHAPENTLSAFREAIAAGIGEIECDCYRLADGEVGVMHDDTIDRTTTGTGSVASQTAADWKSLTIDSAGIMYYGSWPVESPPLLKEVLDLIAPVQWARIWPEGKNTNAVSAICSELLRLRWPSARVVVQVSSVSDAQVATAFGFPSSYTVDPATVDFPTLYGYGIRYVAWTAFTLQQITDLHAAGLKAVTYTKSRRSDADPDIALGVDHIFTDDPLWSSRAVAPVKRDGWARNRHLPGYMGNGGQSWVPVFHTDGSMGWIGSTPSSFRSQLQGWACPINNDEAASEFTITVQIALHAVNSDDRWASVFFCAGSDKKFGDTGAGETVSGYHALFRRNGSVGLYRQTAGQATVSLGSQAGTTRTLEQYYTAAITVTATHITIQWAGQTALTVAEATHRGGYFHFGCSGAQATFKNAVIG